MEREQWYCTVMAPEMMQGLQFHPRCCNQMTVRNGRVKHEEKIIGDFSLTINDFSVSIAEPWMKYQDMIKNYGTLACNCFFAALAGLGGIVIVFTLFYVILKIKCVKIFIILIMEI